MTIANSMRSKTDYNHYIFLMEQARKQMVAAIDNRLYEISFQIEKTAPESVIKSVITKLTNAKFGYKCHTFEINGIRMLTIKWGD